MVTVHYFFDPMCGWCYGATELLSILAKNPAFKIAYHPGGMIQKQVIDPAFRQHILQADAQIAAQTNAIFGEAYKVRVSGSADFVLDSYVPTQAFMVGVEMGQAPHVVLKTIQDTHYRKGLAFEEDETLRVVAHSLGLQVETWKCQMAAAKAAMLKAIEESHTLMNRLHVQGFPTLITEQDGVFTRLPHSAFYGKGTEWEKHLQQYATA